MKRMWLVLLLIIVGMTGAKGAAAGFRPLEFRGRPFFMIGNWDARMGKEYRSVNPFMKGAGMNSLMITVDFMNAAQCKKDLGLIRWFRDNHPDLAVVVDLQLSAVLLQGPGREYRLVPAEKLPARKAIFVQVVQELRKYGNVIGYSVDELENRLYGTLEEWRKKNTLDKADMDQALTRYMEQAVCWVADVIHKYHPEAFYMPVQGWWTTYAESDKLYDVLIANEYPVAGDQKKKKTYYTVAYDAQLAAEATAKFNKRCFIYCPPGFNVLKSGAWKDAREYTMEELRYLWFTPISSGAMGVMGWRQRRATNDFALNKVFPLLNQIKSLVPWLLGENLDQAVTCNRQKDVTEYRIPKRSRMTDQEDHEYHARNVRTITWIARRNPEDRSVMLLACNNSFRPESAYFVFAAPIKARTSVELFSRQTAGIGGRFKVDFKPYDVKVFILADQNRINQK